MCIRDRKKLEADINELEVALNHANKVRYFTTFFFFSRGPRTLSIVSMNRLTLKLKRTLNTTNKSSKIYRMPSRKNNALVKMLVNN